MGSHSCDFLSCAFTVDSVIMLYYLHTFSVRSTQLVLWWLLVKHQQRKSDTPKIHRWLDLGMRVALTANKKASSFHQQNPECHLKENNLSAHLFHTHSIRYQHPTLAVNKHCSPFDFFPNES